MSERILIGLDNNAATQGMIDRLRELGASDVAPIEGIPNALLAYVEKNSADEFIRWALTLPGVRHAEHDQLRSTY